MTNKCLLIATVAILGFLGFSGPDGFIGTKYRHWVASWRSFGLWWSPHSSKTSHLASSSRVSLLDSERRYRAIRHEVLAAPAGTRGAKDSGREIALIEKNLCKEERSNDSGAPAADTSNLKAIWHG